MAEITLNDYVYVKLNDKGREIVRKARDELEERIGRRHRFLMPEERDGWSEWQLWSLISEFGDHCGAGGWMFCDAFTTDAPSAWQRNAAAPATPDISAITRAVSSS